ncbi:MAG: cupin domain-containing protein [Rhodoferax sp.]|uniref:cupin domain-containing protein n=1 Tax=Rhodoferax sp. TaxID=50421 RepID=UPI001B52DEB4|nr:cupin domain-containing protein [Rhodoferax sp.]MBP9905295.1 cupin domain-containing protein [Rhodoferax sp.]
MSLAANTGLNADLSLRCVVASTALPWQASACAQIQRRLLEGEGGEVARSTSLVRYAAGARFDVHLHELGEEILVLEGTLSDEAGQYGPGTYLKNPPDSRHAPWCEAGCLLFVKLGYLDPADTECCVVDTRRATWFQGLVAGLTVLPLSEFGTQHTAMVRWAPGTFFNPHRHYGGEEILVLEGVFSDEHGSYPAGSWLRSPHLSQHQPFSREGCVILVKTGHLPAAPPFVDIAPGAAMPT